MLTRATKQEKAFDTARQVSYAFTCPRYRAWMTEIVFSGAHADLVANSYAPWQATVDECLKRWAALGPNEQARSYLVLRGDAGARRKLNAAAIAELAELSGSERRHAFVLT